MEALRDSLLLCEPPPSQLAGCYHWRQLVVKRNSFQEDESVEPARTMAATPGIEGRLVDAKLLGAGERPVEGNDQQQHRGLGT